MVAPPSIISLQEIIEGTKALRKTMSAGSPTLRNNGGITYLQSPHLIQKIDKNGILWYHKK
jgi:hypothetical protein